MALAVGCVVAGAVFLGHALVTGAVATLYVSIAACVAALMLVALAVIRHQRRSAEPGPAGR